MSHWTFTKGLHDLGNGGYAYLQPTGGYGYSNAGLIVDSGENLLVDTLFDLPLTREMLAEMRRAEPGAQLIQKLVNTHAHPDHTAGNVLVEGAEIYASEATLEEMREIDSPDNPFANMLKNWRNFGEVGEYLNDVMCSKFEVHQAPQLMPTRTFAEEATLSVGNKEVRLLKVGPAHSRGDTLVFVPKDKLLFTGDVLFNEVHPLIMPGAASAWIAACEVILTWDVETIVPGHGPITGKSGVRKLRDYLLFFREESRKRLEAGMNYRDAALDISLDAFRGWVDEERIFGTVNNFYTEMGAKPAPMPEVMTESARYRKLQLARCAAHGDGCDGAHARLLPETGV